MAEAQSKVIKNKPIMGTQKFRLNDIKKTPGIETFVSEEIKTEIDPNELRRAEEEKEHQIEDRKIVRRLSRERTLGEIDSSAVIDKQNKAILAPLLKVESP